MTQSGNQTAVRVTEILLDAIWSVVENVYWRRLPSQRPAPLNLKNQRPPQEGSYQNRSGEEAEAGVGSRMAMIFIISAATKTSRPSSNQRSARLRGSMLLAKD